MSIAISSAYFNTNKGLYDNSFDELEYPTASQSFVGKNVLRFLSGTIDLQKGCAGAKGNEMEETLLLSPKAVNKSLPIILCDEEDVEGEHGATLGRISSEILFYMQSRGISKEAAEAIMARAKVQAVADTIPSDSIKEKIYDYLDKI